ncbi:glycerate kinase [Tautonia rosea]|uniref:glycerate kinase n=1 Tax=Tautonia rosea TaxID=2728037 RepID=UPI0014759B68|nr:glycerate kinase [Tautonia rosea]
MKIVIAPDKFKGSLSAVEAAQAIARGVLHACPQASLDEIPMADGGEGTVDALVTATRGTFRTVAVTGPLGQTLDARFGLSGDGRSAFLEMAAASGLVLVPESQRDPTLTTTRGTGDLILAALDQGVDRIVLGIGGSATNDGGAGMAQAIGFRLLDVDGRDLPPGGGALVRLDQIDSTNRDPRLDHVELAVACDVTNPLCGPQGASAVYGPQKGANSSMVEQLDRNLAWLAEVIARDLGRSVADQPGAGAAGGLGAGLVAFAGGTLQPGVDLISRTIGLADRLKDADLCLTAEGSLDEQTAHGKTIAGVARSAAEYGCPVLALAGSIQPGAEALLDQGLSAYFSLCDRPMSLEDAIAHAASLLERASEQAVRAFLAGRGRA